MQINVFRFELKMKRANEPFNYVLYLVGTTTISMSQILFTLIDHATANLCIGNSSWALLSLLVISLFILKLLGVGRRSRIWEGQCSLSHRNDSIRSYNQRCNFE